MTLLERLQSHRGGLLHIKSELYWYGGRGPDRSPGRVCLLLDAGVGPDAPAGARGAAKIARATAEGVQARTAVAHGSAADDAVALLLIDGFPQWIWVEREDVEIL